MVFNSRYQMPGGFPSTEGDGFGYTEDDYVRMIDGVATTIVEGRDEDFSTPPLEHRDHRPNASHNVPASRGRNRRPVQQDNRANRPGRSSHTGGDPSSQGGTRFHPYNRSQSAVPPNVSGGFEDSHPTPPVAWHNGSYTASQDPYQDSWPSTFNDYGGVYTGTPFAQPNVSDFPNGRSEQDGFELERRPLPWDEGQVPHPATPFSRPVQQSLQTQHGPRESRYPTVPAMDDDGKYPSEEEGYGEASGEQDPPVAKGTKKSKKGSKAKEKVQRGLTQVNAESELEWLKTLDTEGVLAVRHDDIRPQLIAIAEAERVALGVQNEHPDDPGPGKYNVTSFYRKHVRWGPKRDHRPDIDLDWEEDKERNPRPKCPGHMYWEEDGKKYLVLDPHYNPVKDWDLPATIASNIPGYKLEAMRRGNMSLGHKDFWARMPSQINLGTEDQPVWEELGSSNSVVNMPMERFRFHAGLCSWTDRRGTLVIKAGLKKLYGDMLQNNTIEAFGRDLTTREIKEIKKGENAVFPIEGDVVPATQKAAKKRRSTGAARPTKPKSIAKVEKVQSRKRKHSTEDEEEISSEEDAQIQVRSHKRGRFGRKEESIAAEVDDLVMFDEAPIITDQADATHQYSFRSTRNDARASGRVKTTEELSGESSSDEKYEEPQGEGDRAESPSQESLVEENGDDEKIPAPRVPFRRIPRPGDVGGKSKGPSWVSLAGEKGQGNEETDHRHIAIPVNMGGTVHYATYEGLISNEPLHCTGGSGSSPHRQAPETVDAALAQNESYPPQPHPFDVLMNVPLFEQENLEEEDTPLQAHRKWVRDFLRDDGALQRLRTAEQTLPNPRSATHGGSSNPPPPIVSPPNTAPQVDQSSKSPPGPHAHHALTPERKLDVEWAQVFKETFLALGFEAVNFSEVPPWNEEEVESLIDALLPTREVYFAWTGQPAPRTDPQQSYRAQFDTIFGAFQDWWREHRPDDPLPILVGVMHWGRSVDDWEPPSKDSIYFAAFKQGYRAPRGRDGQLLDLPGWRLEDASRKEY